MDKVIFSKEEIILFALMTLDRQIKDELIDEDHLPIARLSDHTQQEIDTLKAKIKTTNTIPHPIDVAMLTEALYEDRDDFVAMFETMVKRATKDGTLPEKQSVH